MHNCPGSSSKGNALETRTSSTGTLAADNAKDTLQQQAKPANTDMPLLASASPRRILLIFDLNGTLLHRLTHDSEWKAFRHHPTVVDKQLSSDLTVNGSKILFRPHYRSLLSRVLELFDVAVWTSARPKNAFPLVAKTMDGLVDAGDLWNKARAHQLSHQQTFLLWDERDPKGRVAEMARATETLPKLVFLWTQEECDVFPALEDSRPRTPNTARSRSPPFVKPLRKKNLGKVWERVSAIRPGVSASESTGFASYSPRDTVIIDDTPEKLADHADNCLLVPEFNVLDTASDFSTDSVLPRLERYLEAMAAEAPQDVRSYLQRNPFPRR